MQVLEPENVGEVREMLRASQSSRRATRVRGANSKARMGGPLGEAEVEIRTGRLGRVLDYDPRDLTISVEAGMSYRELSGVLAEKGQFLPIDPPFAETATVGGILAAHASGRRRRLFGTVRDLVIGMQFAMLDGRLVQSGGMVVKNVAGLDFAKLLTGSMGTLAVITVVNFKLAPAPVGARTFLWQGGLKEVFARRNEILRSVLQPAGLDVLNPAAAGRLGLAAEWTLLVEALGSERLLGRYERELAGFQVIGNEVWEGVREFTPRYLAEHAGAHVLRLSATLMGLEGLCGSLPAEMALVGRAGNGVLYAHAPGAAAVPAGVKGLIEFGPEDRRGEGLWPAVGEDFFLMQKVKTLFDPDALLNRGRLYGRI
jgi:glycolate oxidase FAD binding subunit